MYEIGLLPPAAAAAYEGFTFPARRRALPNHCVDPRFVVLAGSWLGTPAGLVVTALGADRQRAVIESLFVGEIHRAAGLGTALITAVEDHLRRTGCRKAAITFPAPEGGPAPLEKVLKKCSWQPPVTSYEIIQCQAQMPLWLEPLAFRGGDKALAWDRISATMAEEVKRGLGVWYPPQVSPFRDDTYHPASYWYVADGQVAGWLLTRRIGDILLYNTYYVRSELQGTGRALPLLAQGINRQLELAIPYACLRIEHLPEPPNPHLLRLYEKRLKGLAFVVRRYVQAVKVL